MNKEKLQTNVFFGGILAAIIIYAGSKDIVYALQMLVLFWVIAFLLDTKLAIRRLKGEGTPKDNLLAAQALIQKAATADRNREPEQAETLYLKAIDLLKIEHDFKPKEALPLLAPTYYNLAVVQGNAKKIDAAIPSYQASIKLYHQLFQINSEAFLASLADALYQLGQLHLEKKEWDAAQKNYESALKLFRRVQAESTDNAFYVAYILDKLAEIAEKKEDIPTAIKHAKESIAVYRTLAVKAPKRFKSKLAEATYYLANLFAEKKEAEKAEILYLETADIYTKLVEVEPSNYTTSLAATWSALGLHSRKNDHFQKAATYFQKAFLIWEESAKKDFTNFAPLAVKAQFNWALAAHKTEESEVVEQNFKEAILGYQQLAKVNPEVHLPDLNLPLEYLKMVLKERNKVEEIEGFYTETLQVVRSLEKEKTKSWYLLELSELLLNFSDFYQYIMEYEKAKKVIEESIAIRRKLAETDATTYQPYLLKSLIAHGKAFYFSADGEHVEKPYLEALAMVKNSDKSTFYLENNAIILHDLAKIYMHKKEYEKAEEHGQKALNQIEELAKEDKDTYQFNIAWIESSYGDILLKQNKLTDAENHYQKGLTVIQKLVEKDTEKYEPGLAYFYIDFMELNVEKKTYPAAEKYALLAYEILEKNAEKLPWQYDLGLANVCLHLGELYQTHIVNKAKSIQFAQQGLDLYGKYKDKRKCAQEGYEAAIQIVGYWAM